MLIDNKGKLFGKINVLDLVVILAVLVVIAGVAYKFTKSNTPSVFRQNDKVEITFYVEELPDYAADAVEVGAPVTDRTTGSKFGVVKSVDTQPSVSYAPNSAGEIVKSTKETFRSQKVVVAGEGLFSDNGVTYNSIDYYVNKQLEVRFGNVAVWTRVYDVQVVK
jgi:hypothetical protein